MIFILSQGIKFYQLLIVETHPAREFNFYQMFIVETNAKEVFVKNENSRHVYFLWNNLHVVAAGLPFLFLHHYLNRSWIDMIRQILNSVLLLSSWSLFGFFRKDVVVVASKIPSLYPSTFAWGRIKSKYCLRNSLYHYIWHRAHYQ